MMKAKSKRSTLILAALVVCPFAISIANAQTPAPTAEPVAVPPLGQPVTVNGSYFTRYEWRDNYDRLGVSKGRFQEGDRTVYRFRTSLTTGPMVVGADRTVTAFFAPQASGFLPGAGTAGSTNPTIGESDLGVLEGFIRIASPVWDLEVGRFMMNYGNSALIGNLDWHQSARSFQGARWVLHLPEKAHVDAFFTQQVEGGPAVDRFTGGDEYFAGAYAVLGPMVHALKALDVYALSKLWGARSGAAPALHLDNAAETTVGSLVKGEAGVMDYNVEAGLQIGQRRLATMVASNVDVFAYNVELELGVKVGKNLRLAAYGAHVSGDDGKGSNNSWDELYPTGHAFFGLMDVMGPRSNITDGAFRLSYAFTGETTAKFDFHNFFRPQDANPVLAAKQDGYAGSEANLNVAHRLGKGLVMRGLYGLFLPNKDVFGRNDTAHYLEVELRYDF
jgi:Alginate export